MLYFKYYRGFFQVCKAWESVSGNGKRAYKQRRAGHAAAAGDAVLHIVAHGLYGKQHGKEIAGDNHLLHGLSFGAVFDFAPFDVRKISYSLLPSQTVMLPHIGSPDKGMYLRKSVFLPEIP